MNSALKIYQNQRFKAFKNLTHWRQHPWLEIKLGKTWSLPATFFDILESLLGH